MNKMKKSNNGFTLIELIAVITILALIAIIVTPIINSTLNENREKLYKRQIEGIIESAKVWGANNVGKLPAEGEQPIEITLSELTIGGYAEKGLKNPKTDTLFDDVTTKVIISNENGVLNYTVIVN